MQQLLLDFRAYLVKQVVPRQKLGHCLMHPVTHDAVHLRVCIAYRHVQHALIQDHRVAVSIEIHRATEDAGMLAGIGRSGVAEVHRHRVLGFSRDPAAKSD